MEDKSKNIDKKQGKVYKGNSMYITPVIPSTNEIKLDNKLLKKAEMVIIESAKLTGGYNKHFISAIKEWKIKNRKDKLEKINTIS